MYEDIKKDPRFKKLNKLFEELNSNYPVSLRLVFDEKLEVPLEIFSKKLGSFETIIKYLHENKDLEFKKIAKLTGRSLQNVYVTYNNSKKNIQKNLESLIQSIHFLFQ